jgi:hypothetical protein
MALSETYGSREITFTRTGASATRKFRGTRAEAMLYSPKPGEAFPGWEGLTVDSVKITPTGEQGTNPESLYDDYTAAWVDVSYTMEFRKPTLGDPPSVTWDMSTEVLNTGAGRVYDDTGDKIDVEDLSTATVYPMMSIAYDFAVSAIPLTAIFAALGTVNSAEWQGCAAGTLLFEGASATAQYNYETQSWYHRLTYRFIKRMRSHNEIWRPGKRVFDKDLNNGLGDYVKNADGTYQYVAGDDGEGAWTTTTPVLYESTDFKALEAP